MTVTLKLITVVTDSCLRGWSALIVFKRELLSSSNKGKFSERNFLNNHASWQQIWLDIVVRKLIDEQISTLNGYVFQLIS